MSRREEIIAELKRRGDWKSFLPEKARNLVRSQRKGYGVSPLGFLPTNPDEAIDISRVAARQVIPGAQPSRIGIVEQGPIGVGLNLAGIRETKGMFPPETYYGEQLEGGANIAQMISGLKQALTLTPGQRINKMGGRDKVLRKAEEELISVLQPPKTVMKYAKAGEKIETPNPESIKKSLPFINKAKTYEDLYKSLAGPKARLGRMQKERIRGNNFKLGNFLIALEEKITRMKGLPEARTESGAKDIAKLEELYTAYKDWSEGKGGLTRMQGQLEKQRLQKSTLPLLTKRGKGVPLEKSPIEQVGEDAIRFGLRKEVEGGDAVLARINELYPNLKESASFAQNQANLAKSAPPRSMMQKIPLLKEFLLGRKAPQFYAAYEALNQQPSLGKRTENIAKLYELASKEINPITGEFVEGGALTPPGYNFGYNRPVRTPSAPSGQKMIEGAVEPRKLLSGRSPMAIEASPSYGEGFERLDPETSGNRLWNWATKFFKPKGTSQVSGVEITPSPAPISPKKVGLNPITGEYKWGKPKTSLAIAMKRRAR